MSKYTDNKHEHERINANCKKYRQTHREKYNEQNRARYNRKINNMTVEELEAYREKKKLISREYRARKKAEAQDD